MTKQPPAQSVLYVFYEDVMDDYPGELQRLAAFLGKPERAQQVDVQQAVEEFIERRIQNYHRSVGVDTIAEMAPSAERL